MSDDAPMGHGIGALIFLVLTVALGAYYLIFGSGWLGLGTGVVFLLLGWHAYGRPWWQARRRGSLPK